MINLMYLVFIAMLALNMSKEVLTAFGLIEEEMAENNEVMTERNDAALSQLSAKAADQQSFKAAASAAQKIEDISANLDDHIADLKCTEDYDRSPDTVGHLKEFLCCFGLCHL